MWQKMSVVDSTSEEDTAGNQPPPTMLGAGHQCAGRIGVCSSYRQPLIKGVGGST